MFAGLLNKGFRGSMVLLITFFFLAAFASFFSVKGLEDEYYPNLFYNFFTRNLSSRTAITLLNYLFIAAGVLLVSMITLNQEIVDKQNYFPVFLFLLFSVTGANPAQLTSQIFTNVITLYAIYRLLDIYRQEHVLGQIFNAAFWLSVSAFITISSIISFPLFFVILLILRPFHWREWVMALMGFFVPFFLYECMAYLSDFNQWYLPEAIVLYMQSMKVPSFSEYYLPLSVELFILLLLSVVSSLMSGFGNTVKKQRSKSILLWMLFFSAFGFFSGGASSSSILLTFAFPLSFFIGDFLFSMKQVKIANTILTFLLLASMVVFAGELGIL